MQLLAISGSLRAGASNTLLLQAAALVAPPNVSIAIYDALGTLPHFNPDLDSPDGTAVPEIVLDLRARVGRADGVLMSCPEYAHGIPGSFKNLLDWLVGSIEFPNKPVALLNTSPMSVHAPAQLVEVLTTMNARLVTDACATIPIGRRLDAAAIAADPELSAMLRAAVAILVENIRAHPHRP
jgi:chromate reductase, NAD(P)H dehydrogenase (quinone)